MASTPPSKSNKEGRVRQLCSSFGTHLSVGNSDDHQQPRTRLDLLLSQSGGWVENVAPSKFAKPTPMSTFVFPSLSLFPPPSVSAGCTQRVNSPFKAQQTAMRNLGFPLLYEAARLDLAPNQMAVSAASSFETLVEANLRQFFKNRALRSTFDKVCSSAEVCREFDRAIYEDVPGGRRKLIRISSVSTSFLAETDRPSNICSANSREFSFSVAHKMAFTILISDKPVALSIDGRGSIAGLWSKDDPSKVCKTVLTLEVDSLLTSLRLKARLVALQAIRELPSRFPSNFTPNDDFGDIISAVPSNVCKRKRFACSTFSPQPLSSSYLIPDEETVNDHSVSFLNGKKKPKLREPSTTPKKDMR